MKSQFPQTRAIRWMAHVQQWRESGLGKTRYCRENGGFEHEQAVPILDAIRAILDYRIDHVPPKSLLGQAMIYARNQWTRAVSYVDCGLLTPDNNAAESAIRPVALGRKNWLFSGAPKGASASAMIFP